MDIAGRVLVVGDDSPLRASMVREFAKLEGVRVVAAENICEAKKLLSRERLDVLVFSLDLPDGSGLEVVAEAERLGLRVPVAFVSGFVVRNRSRLPLRASVPVYELPVSFARLQAWVEQHLVPRGDGAPTRAMGVLDYVRLASVGRSSVVLEIRSARGRGQIVIHRGRPWQARDDEGEGMPAFQRLAFRRSMTVTCRTLAAHELPAANMEGEAEQVLLAATRAFDEAPTLRDARTCTSLPPPVPPQARLAANSRLAASAGPTIAGPPARASAPPPLFARVPEGALRQLEAPQPVCGKVVLEPLRLPPLASVAHLAASARVESPARGRLPPLPKARPVRERFDDAYERAVDAVLQKDFARAHAALVQADKLVPLNRLVTANLARLRAMGIP